MATIGKWGKNVTFSVSDKKILTFQDLKRTAGGRWATHNIIGHAPKKEFQGRQSQTITMKITVDARWGIKPRHALAVLRAASQTGEVNYLYIGGTKMCANKLYIESVSESWDEVWNKGELVKAQVNVTFGEYV